jgi:hypothetical protein
MQLVRFALLALGSRADDWNSFGLTHEGVSVAPLGIAGGSDPPLLLLSATMPLDQRPVVDGDGFVEVPEDARRRAETALQVTANLLSIATGGSRALSSPSLHVAFHAQGSDERDWLGQHRGITEVEHGRSLPAFSVRLEERHLAALGDRLEGAALVAEALANAHLTGRFHELVRLFELAFAENANRVVLHVADFLSAWPLLGYSKTEVKRWLIRLRNPATHVDRAGRNGIVLEVDLRSVIGRMTMAAYDVLLNKRNWGDPSVDRRDLWRPETGVLGPNGDQVFVRQHSTPAPLEAQILDGFGAFALNLAVGGPRLGDNFWPTAPTSTTAPIAGGVRVVPGDEIAPTP